MSSLEIVYDYFEDPLRAAGRIEKCRPVTLGLLCILTGALSFFLAQALSDHLSILSFSWSSCLLILIWRFSAAFLFTAVLHLILEMGSVRGSAVALFVHLGLSELAWGLILPLAIIGQLTTGYASWAMPGAIFLGAILNLGLKARAIRDNYHVGLSRAWLTLCLPYFATVGMVLLVFFLAMLGLLSRAFY
jgi:hypothetical protein